MTEYYQDNILMGRGGSGMLGGKYNVHEKAKVGYERLWELMQPEV